MLWLMAFDYGSDNRNRDHPALLIIRTGEGGVFRLVRGDNRIQVFRIAGIVVFLCDIDQQFSRRDRVLRGQAGYGGRSGGGR